MKTFTEVAEWCVGGLEAYGDASVPVCQLFVRYLTDLETCTGDTLACTMIAEDLVLVLAPTVPLQVIADILNERLFRISVDRSAWISPRGVGRRG